MNKIKKNLQAYKNKDKKGYGIQFPEGHLIRIVKHIINYELKKNKGKCMKTIILKRYNKL